MHFNQLGSLAALTGLAQAFLIPPTIEPVDRKIAASKIVEGSDIPYEALAAARSDQLLVNCPECPVVFAKDNVVNHAQSKLRFNLTIQHEEGTEDSLLMNGVQVFPVNPASAIKALHADQVVRGPKSLDGFKARWVYAASPELGYSMNVRSHEDRRHPGLTAHTIHMRIREVANELVRSVPAIDIKLLKTSNGKLMLANSHVIHAPPKDNVVAIVSNPECTSTICRWRITFMDGISSLRKGCGDKSPKNRLPRPSGIFKTGPAGHPRPAGFEHSRPHAHGRQGHRHRRHGGVARIIRNIVFHILVPMAVGLAVGITASIVGAIVGQLIVFIWRALFRRGERGQCSRQRAEKTDVEDEKTAFLEAQEAPPMYEQAVEDEKAEQK